MILTNRLNNPVGSVTPGGKTISGKVLLAGGSKPTKREHLRLTQARNPAPHQLFAFTANCVCVQFGSRGSSINMCVRTYFLKKSFIVSLAKFFTNF